MDVGVDVDFGSGFDAGSESECESGVSVSNWPAAPVDSALHHWETGESVQYKWAQTRPDRSQGIDRAQVEIVGESLDYKTEMMTVNRDELGGELRKTGYAGR
jgi:hypothetical protein